MGTDMLSPDETPAEGAGARMRSSSMEYSSEGAVRGWVVRHEPRFLRLDGARRQRAHT